MHGESQHDSALVNNFTGFSNHNIFYSFSEFIDIIYLRLFFLFVDDRRISFLSLLIGPLVSMIPQGEYLIFMCCVE